MLFSSPEFILFFLPVTFAAYFFLNKLRLVLAAKAWLAAMSLWFYAYWNITYLPLLLISIFFNYAAGSALIPQNQAKQVYFSRKGLLELSVFANLGLLAYFKYANFLVDNYNSFFTNHFQLNPIILPLGISFFTFTQIAFLVDCYRGKAKEYDFLNYLLFVTFFPHLIAGPILHHQEMMSQFESRWTRAVRYRNVFNGLFIFSIGLFKKVILADTFALWANSGFDHNIPLDFFSAWATSLAYTLQLYFDFSGYCDMAIGASLLFNIWLPINFNSPYKALTIQDFWRRWHMTLSRYLRDYLYIPLGGNRCCTARIYFNLLVTFVLGGLWHGASWMFILWGALHGIALIIQRIWQQTQPRLPKILAWLITFNFVNATWVIFRAKTWDDALRIFRGMTDVSSIFGLEISQIPIDKLAWGGKLMDGLLKWLPNSLAINFLPIGAISLAFWICRQRNSLELLAVQAKFGQKLTVMSLLFIISLYTLLMNKSTVFLYFNF